MQPRKTRWANDWYVMGVLLLCFGAYLAAVLAALRLARAFGWM